MTKSKQPRKRRSREEAAANPMVGIGGQVTVEIDKMLGEFAAECGISRSEALRRLIPAGIAALNGGPR